MLMMPPFKVDVALREEWGANLAKWSDLWPQHLHNAMTALALVAAEDDDYGLGAESLAERVKERAMAFRQHSYWQRVNSEALQDTPLLVARIMADLPEGGLVQYGTVAAIERHVDDRPGWRLPENMTAKGFFNHLVHKGLLQEVDNERYACPIPTLRDFLIRRGGIDPETPETRLLTRQEPVSDDRTEERDTTASLPDPTEIRDPSPFKDSFG